MVVALDDVELIHPIVELGHVDIVVADIVVFFIPVEILLTLADYS